MIYQSNPLNNTNLDESKVINQENNQSGKYFDSDQQKRQTRKKPHLLSKLIYIEKRKYSKADEQQKAQLLKKVLKEGMKINHLFIFQQAAKEVGLKYATAKTIIYKFREQQNPNRLLKKELTKQSKYISINKRELQKIYNNLIVVITQSGEIIREYNYFTECLLVSPNLQYK